MVVMVLINTYIIYIFSISVFFYIFLSVLIFIQAREHIGILNQFSWLIKTLYPFWSCDLNIFNINEKVRHAIILFVYYTITGYANKN